MQIKDALREGTERLRSVGRETPRLDSALLLAHALSSRREHLHTHPEELVPEPALRRFERMLSRREAGEPVQYITGIREFMSLDFAVGPGVLIPRPETEVLVEAALELLRFSGKPELLVADIGTGAGAIAVSVCVHAAKFADVSVLASDPSEQALGFAKQNAARHGANNRVRFLQADLFASHARYRRKIDAILSNPPYIPHCDIADLPIEVRGFEPQIALDGGHDGLSFYRRIVRAAPEYLCDGGFLMLEVGAGQSERVLSMLKSNGFSRCDTKADLAGIDRVVWGFREAQKQ